MNLLTKSQPYPTVDEAAVTIRKFRPQNNAENVAAV